MTTLRDSVCPHCGASLNFTANTKIVHCDFCDSDIIIEQNQPPRIPERNIPVQQGQNFPPSLPFDEPAFRKWKKKYHTCHIILSILTIIFILMIEVDSHSDAALLPFTGGLFLSIISPIVLGGTKPDEPDVSRNRKGWNIFKYYLQFAGNIVISFVISIIIAVAFGIA
ncbi:MAG: hypothetical protein IJ644_09225 [Oscillospiraceae bacterium]|nr:hypothetical protein [Oscillospiraceae bacterium]